MWSVVLQYNGVAMGSTKCIDGITFDPFSTDILASYATAAESLGIIELWDVRHAQKLVQATMGSKNLVMLQWSPTDAGVWATLPCAGRVTPSKRARRVGPGRQRSTLGTRTAHTQTMPRHSPRREERVTVQGPIRKPTKDEISHRRGGSVDSAVNQVL